MTQTFTDLDVRPILRRGEDPFAQIMEAIASLPPGEGLRLYAPFKPVPLFHVLANRGFGHEVRELGGGDWEVLFTPMPVVQAPEGDGAQSAPADADWPEPARYLDNRDLDPPEPMVRILAALEALEPGQVLASLLVREPLFLFPELAKRGHAWRGEFSPAGDTYELLVRVGGLRGGAA